MIKAMDEIHKKILRKFHALCTTAGLKESEKRAIIESYGVESSADINTHELIDICATLEKQINGGKAADLDTLRKRLIAAIGAYLRAMGKEDNINIIKATACRASGHDSFNKIPAERLRSLYNAFKTQKKDIDAVSKLTSEYLHVKPLTDNIILN